METNQIINSRYATKIYDPKRRISKEDMSKIEALLQMSPSSVNSQPWHFIIADTDEAKKRLSKATQGGFGFNEDKILNSAAVVVFAGKNEISDEYLLTLLNKEEKDGRFLSEDFKADQDKARKFYVNKRFYEFKDLRHWIEKQVYLNLGFFLMGVANLGLDATPMEGFNKTILDKELYLHQQGYSSVVMVALGYHAENDFNAKLPKSRFDKKDIITKI
jgi:nitroreductase/dihydropteridine reductase